MTPVSNACITGSSRKLGTIVAKTHMPYALDADQLARWTTLFVDADYEVTELPPYVLESASNPFRTFAQLPT